jgi:uncharacterized membrane protein YcaP (DUF421 family)
MESIIRAALFYLFMLLVFRVSPKRSLEQLTPFEFILLLMLGGLAMPAIQTDDRSATNAILLILTLLGIQVVISWLKVRSPLIAKIVGGTPTLVFERGRSTEAARKLMLEEQDVLTAVRAIGLERLDQVKWVVVERNGKIQAIPTPKE